MRSSRTVAASIARADHGPMPSKSPRKRLSAASSSISATASGEAGSRSSATARSSLAFASVCRPSRRSTPAHATVSRTRSFSASSGTIPMLSISVAWLSANRPIAASASRTRQQQLNPLLRRRVLGEQAERSAEPAGCARRRALCRRPDRLRAGSRPPPRRPGERPARRGARALTRAHHEPGAPRHCARARRDASRPASTRRPHGGRADAGTGIAAAHRCGGQRPGGGARRGRPSPRPRSRPTPPRQAPDRTGLRRPRLPRADGGAPTERRPSSSASAAATLVRDSHTAMRELSGDCGSCAGAVEHPRQLLEIERVAAALLEELCRSRPADRLAEELAGFAARERRQLKAMQRPGAVRSLDRREEPLRHLAGAHRQGEQHGRGRRPVEECTEQLDGSRVGPVEVVEHEHDRARAREQLQQLAYRAVAPVALVLERRPPFRLRAPTATGRPAPARFGRRRRERRGNAARALRRTPRARPRAPRTVGLARALRPIRRGRGARSPRPGRRARRAGASCRSLARR